MKRQELVWRLRAEGFRRDAYYFDEDPPYDGLVMRRVSTGWVVEYVERGMRDELGSFATEDEACDALYRELCRDSSARER